MAPVPAVDCVAVMGLGYVGIRIAHEAEVAGLTVRGYDTDRRRIESLRARRSYVDDLGDKEVGEMADLGFLADHDPAILESATVVIICVPTPLHEDGTPDLAMVRAAAETIVPYLRPDMLVSLESTTYPGTTEEIVRPILERSGLVAGRDFSLTYSPERIDPGNRDHGLRNTPKIIGGLTPQCAEHAARVYGKFIDRIVLTRGLREAEMAKLLENTYRNVNIALVNELAISCAAAGIDVWEVVAAASTKPFGFESFRPGPGVGGHCIPVDPRYLSHWARSSGRRLSLVELAADLNDAMPGYLADRIEQVLAELGVPLAKSSVLLLGVTYKADVADTREAPSAAIARALKRRGARLFFHDPHVTTWSVDEVEITRADLRDGVAAVDIVVLAQHHSAYDVDKICARARAVFDPHGKVQAANTFRL